MIRPRQGGLRIRGTSSTGLLDVPVRRLPEPFRSAALRARPTDVARWAEPSRDPRPNEPGAERHALSLSISSPDHFATSRSPGANLPALPPRGFLYDVSEDEELVVDLEAGVRLVVELKAISEPDTPHMRTVLAQLSAVTAVGDEAQAGQTAAGRGRPS